MEKSNKKAGTNSLFAMSYLVKRFLDETISGKTGRRYAYQISGCTYESSIGKIQQDQISE